MNRQTTKDASVWQSNKCFELFIESPYKSPQSYHTFSKAFTPKCRVANYPKIKVDCKVSRFSAKLVHIELKVSCIGEGHRVKLLCKTQ